MKVPLIIIGSGPAAYTAAIYAARAALSPLVFEGFLSGPVGGQLMTTTEVDNFPGFSQGVLGSELMNQCRAQCLRFGATTIQQDVSLVECHVHPFVVHTQEQTYHADSVIIATGATAKTLDIPGAKALWQKGVTACAVCDGPMPIFRNKELYVIGGGDSAVEEAMFLTKYAQHVYIIHRRDQLRASKIMAQRALTHPKITVVWNSVVQEICGDTVVSDVIIKNLITNTEKQYSAGGVFFAIGHQPNTAFLQGQLALNEQGYIITHQGTHTSQEGIFAAGDVQDNRYRQAITAAGTGCMAALDAEKWLVEKHYI